MPNQRAQSSTCLSKQGTTQIKSHDLLMPLPLGAILLASDINQKLATINAELKGTILNLFTKTGKD